MTDRRYLVHVPLAGPDVEQAIDDAAAILKADVIARLHIEDAVRLGVPACLSLGISESESERESKSETAEE